jgi:two-component system response regulator MprA
VTGLRAASPDGAPRRATVLLVEDDEGIRETVADSLRFEGYDVALATNGAEALEWIDAGGAPAVVLLDLVMPVMDGQELLHRLRERAEHLPVIVMTAALGAGPAAASAEMVLAKPFDLSDLLAAVERFTKGAPPGA